MTGTARYASRNAHNGVEQSRRDDLESIGYMLIYFFKGKLPWQGLNTKDKEEKYRKIKEMKNELVVEEFCEGLPSVLLTRGVLRLHEVCDGLEIRRRT